jgi:hypothetical protein
MTRLGPTCLWPWQLSWPHALCHDQSYYLHLAMQVKNNDAPYTFQQKIF